MTKTWASKGSFRDKGCISVHGSSYYPCPEGTHPHTPGPSLHPLFAYTALDIIRHPASSMVYTLMIPHFYLLTRVLPLKAHLTSP